VGKRGDTPESRYTIIRHTPQRNKTPRECSSTAVTPRRVEQNNDVFGSLVSSRSPIRWESAKLGENPEILFQAAHEFNVRSTRAIGSEAEDSTKRKREEE